MISDTLSDTAEELRAYLRDFPDTYRRDKRAVEALIRRMDALRKHLDTPPK